MYERVNAKRFVAALLDAIITGIITGIPVAIYTFTVGIESIVDSLAGSFAPGGGGFGVGTTQAILNYTAVSVIIGLVVGVFWFVWFPAKNNGQTIGKKVMNIKAIDDNGDNPTLKQHFIRSIQNWSGYVALPLIVIGYVSLGAYDILNAILGNGIGILAFVSYLMVLFKADGRGLHDIISNTTIVSTDVNPNQSFQEKAAQMSDWAEVDDKPSNSDEEDEWKY